MFLQTNTPIGRLSEVNGPLFADAIDYSYDPVGNRLSEVIHTPSVNETLWSENFTGQNDKGGFVSGGVETTDTAGVD